MSKAFYTVGHELLLIKHFLIMVGKNPSIVIMSYLSIIEHSLYMRVGLYLKAD